MAFNDALSYTAGNWTVVDLVDDTIAAGKTLTIPDLDYAHDFVKVEDTATEAKLVNVTSSALGPVETIRYAKSDVKNVYTNTDVGSSNQMPAKTGIRTLIEVSTLISATNSVSGEEYMVPVRAWTCVQVPTASFISNDVLRYVLGRAFGAMFDTSDATIARTEEVARGSLLP